MRFRLAGSALVTASLAVSLACATSASAADGTSTTPSSTTVTIPVDAGDSGALTPAELQRQIARADALRAEILASDKNIAAAMTKLDKAAKKANSALEAYSNAMNDQRAATQEAQTQSEIASALQERLNTARQDLRDWAVSAYTQGGPLAESLTYLDALSKDASKASNPLSDLNYLTDNRIRTVDDLREYTIAQKLASMRADAAKDKADAAAKSATTRKTEAKKAVEQQNADLAELRKVHLAHVEEAGPLAGILLGSGDPNAIDASTRLTKALAASNISVKDLRLSPCTDKTGMWSNGQIPPSALCPLVGSTDEFLVPQAAAAFNAMSKAYAEDTGALLCVTDGYRSYAEQVAVKAARGPWAATPGTSEHGLGRAVDLCGGVQDYSSPAHLWLVQNAALFGWFHPSWAAQGGTLPEPWHWEFAG